MPPAQEYCPECGEATADCLHHFLTIHQESPVPRSIVIAWLRQCPDRCWHCYKRAADVVKHTEINHTPSVEIRFGVPERTYTVYRGADNMLTCPWCGEKAIFSEYLQVR
jgi:hypothetical protein